MVPYPFFPNSSDLRKIFAPKKLVELARGAPFIERRRDLTASAFVHLCTFSQGADAYPTLGQMKAELLRFRIGMARSSISERFDQSAVDYGGACSGFQASVTCRVYFAHAGFSRTFGETPPVDMWISL